MTTNKLFTIARYALRQRYRIPSPVEIRKIQRAAISYSKDLNLPWKPSDQGPLFTTEAIEACLERFEIIADCIKGDTPKYQPRFVPQGKARIPRRDIVDL